MEPELELKAAPDADNTEADVSEAALGEAEGEEEEEKAPMTEAGPQEQNGAVKLKIPEEDEEPEVQFTGLSKEELLRVAGTPGWRRTRWALLVFFWLSWLGMLAAAVLIILKAPPCRPLPSLNWWNEAPLFRVRSIQNFSSSGDIKGVEQRLDHLLQLKVKGLVLGPIHVAPKDDPMNLSFQEVSKESGSLDQMKSLLTAAHKKNLFLVLDLSPNYGGSDVWFSNSSISSVTERLKLALVFWLTLGVDGVKLDSVDQVLTQVPSQWNDIRAIVQNWTDSRPHKRLLLGSSLLSSPSEVSVLMGEAGVDLLMSPVLAARLDATERAQTAQLLSSGSGSGPVQPLWSLESEEQCVYSELLLLLTLPGTALIQSGDEGGAAAQNQTQASPSCLPLLSSLSSLRSKERSLKFGDFLVLSNSSSVLVYLRSWDQSPRFLVLINSSPEVIFSSNATVLPPKTEVELKKVQLGPGESALLQLQHG